MLRKLQNKREEGFTIIEVLIVLAIGGLIMLIVFLAVPALQRNARNTQRKNDVSNLLGAVAEYTSNNGGKLPNRPDASQIEANTSLSFYDPANVRRHCLQALTTSTASEACPAATLTVNNDEPNQNEVIIVYGAKCTGGNNVTTTGASVRNIAVMYRVEASSGVGQAVCTES